MKIKFKLVGYNNSGNGTLDLSDKNINSDQIELHLKELSKKPETTKLILKNNKIDATGALSISMSTYLSNVVELDLSDNSIMDGGFSALMNPFEKTFPHLKVLKLSRNGINIVDPMALICIKGFYPELEVLNLSGNDYDKKAVENAIAEENDKTLPQIIY